MMEELTEQDIQEYRDDIALALTEIETREDLTHFVKMLNWGYENGLYEEQSVSDYLGGTCGLLMSLDSWYRNRGKTESPDEPTWTMFAEILLASFYHS
ncbi:MAG: hypothetical protein KDE22_11035 [Rhodobacterales bacterium]|nr:hypothetical protein [Rhodobacterales bacterium]